MIIYVYILGKDTCWISWISQLLAMANTQWTGDGCSIPCCTFRLSAVGARIKSGRRHSQDLKYTNQHSPATLRCDQDLWELASSLQSVNRDSRPVGNCWSKLRSRTRQWIHHPANMLRMKRSQLEPTGITFFHSQSMLRQRFICCLQHTWWVLPSNCRASFNLLTWHIMAPTRADNAKLNMVYLSSIQEHLEKRSCWQICTDLHFPRSRIPSNNE